MQNNTLSLLYWQYNLIFIKAPWIHAHFISEDTWLCSFDCWNKIPETGWLLNNKYLHLTVMENGSLRLRCQHGHVRALFWVTDFWLYLHMVQRQGSFVGFVFKGTDPIYEGSTLMIQLPQSPPPPPNTITKSIKIVTYEFWRGKTSDHSRTEAIWC